MKRAICIAAGSVLVGSLSWTGMRAMAADEHRDRNEQRERTEQREANRPLAFPPGFEQKDTKDNKAAASEIATLTDDALTPNHFDNFINNFVNKDRYRLRDDKNRDVADLNGKINVIRKFWHDKYGHDFDISKSDLVYGPVEMIRGEVRDPTQAVMNWPLNPRNGQPDRKSEQAIAAAEHENGKLLGGREKLDKGRNVAVVRFEMSHGLPAVTASMVHEMPAQWRFDIPGERNGQQIYNDLLNQLNFVATHSHEWPNDEKEAYQMVAHRVLAAAYGVDASMQAPADRRD